MSSRETDPWQAQVKVVDELLSEEHINVPNQFNMRQIKRFAQMEALSYLYKLYLLRWTEDKVQKDASWLDIMITSYKTLLKANKGWAVKLAARVASMGTQARMLLNMQKVKERLVGHE